MPQRRRNRKWMEARLVNRIRSGGEWRDQTKTGSRIKGSYVQEMSTFMAWGDIGWRLSQWWMGLGLMVEEMKRVSSRFDAFGARALMRHSLQPRTIPSPFKVHSLCPFTIILFTPFTLQVTLTASPLLSIVVSKERAVRLPYSFLGMHDGVLSEVSSN